MTKLKINDGFTLIELLVVISILALLLAVIVPALSKARDQAKTVVCKNNMRQIGIAINLYACSNNDRLIPGDYVMGHDIWNVCSELPGDSPQWMKYVSGPRNLGYLLKSNYLPMPQSNQHPFYCPAMSISACPWGFKYDGMGTVIGDRGFDGWGRQGRIVNISYEFYDSIDDNEPGNIFLSRIGNKPLVCDIISWGSGRYAHKTKYNFLRADTSVDIYLDNGSPDYLYVIFLHRSPDRIMFEILDKGGSVK